MVFFFVALAFMYVGRKLGWALSKSTLYTQTMPVAVVLCLVWGAAVALAMRGLLNWQQPGLILRWIMGYALGGYVAIPNFGLLDKSTIRSYAEKRHLLVSTLPTVMYVACSVVLAFL